jgi:hypothetical protein
VKLGAVFAGVIVASLITGCTKSAGPSNASPATANPKLAQLIVQLDTVEQWSRGPDRKDHVAWLASAVAWDITGAVAMTSAAAEIDDSRVDGLLRSGLAELAAGPGDHAASLVAGWRRALGTASCQSGAATDDDVHWARERLALPVPKGAGPDTRDTLTGYAARAKDTGEFVRIECGGASRLIVGVLGDRLVPIVRT